MFLHQRIEVLIGLLQRASIVWSAKQAANAVGVEALTQPFGKRLRQAFQDLADAKPLREQPANSVHRAVTATIHADLRSRKGAPHRLGLIDMNVAIGLDAVRQTIDLGGETEKVDAEFSQFAGSRKANRLVLTVGKFSVVDIFDTNKYANSPNSDFLSWSTVNAGSFDYAGDAWAYSPGHALGRREINTALRVQDVAAGNAA